VITIAWYVAKKFGATWQLSTAFVLLSTVMIIVMIGSLAIFAVLELYDILTEQITGSTSSIFAWVPWPANTILPGMLGLGPIIWWSVISIRTIKIATKIGKLRSIISLLLGILVFIPVSVAVGFVMTMLSITF